MDVSHYFASGLSLSHTVTGRPFTYTRLQRTCVTDVAAALPDEPAAAVGGGRHGGCCLRASPCDIMKFTSGGIGDGGKSGAPVTVVRRYGSFVYFRAGAAGLDAARHNAPF